MHGWSARHLSPHDSPTVSKGTAARVEFLPVPRVHERHRSITLLTPINSNARYFYAPTIAESLKPRSRLINFIERISCEILVETAGIDNETTVSCDISCRTRELRNLLLRSKRLGHFVSIVAAWSRNAVSRTPKTTIFADRCIRLINFAVISKLFRLYFARIFFRKCLYLATTCRRKCVYSNELAPYINKPHK